MCFQRIKNSSRKEKVAGVITLVAFAGGAAAGVGLYLRSITSEGVVQKIDTLPNPTLTHFLYDIAIKVADLPSLTNFHDLIFNIWPWQASQGQPLYSAIENASNREWSVQIIDETHLNYTYLPNLTVTRNITTTSLRYSVPWQLGGAFLGAIGGAAFAAIAFVGGNCVSKLYNRCKAPVPSEREVLLINPSVELNSMFKSNPIRRPRAQSASDSYNPYQSISSGAVSSSISSQELSDQRRYSNPTNYQAFLDSLRSRTPTPSSDSRRSSIDSNHENPPDLQYNQSSLYEHKN